MSSEFIREFEQNFPNTRKIREETARILEQGGELAFKEIQGANFEKLKEKIRKNKV